MRRPPRRRPAVFVAPPAAPAKPHIETGSFVYDKDLDCMVPKRGRNYHDTSELRSDLPCPAMHAGGMTEIQSMADGRRYETKRNYYKSVSRAGCEIVGYDKNWGEHVDRNKPKFGADVKAHTADIARDVKKAMEKIGGYI